jgi:Flp pilus assembly protein TadG
MFQATDRKTRRCKNCRRRGSITLEFAILLPVLLTLVVLCVDFGRFAHSFIAVTNAARAGAGYASLHPVTPATRPAWNAAVEQAVINELSGNGWFDEQPSDLAISTPEVIDEGNGLTRVRVEVTFQFRPFLNWPLLPNFNEDNPIQLRRAVVMRMIR